jgi:hypothetical protein
MATMGTDIMGICACDIIGICACDDIIDIWACDDIMGIICMCGWDDIMAGGDIERIPFMPGTG